MTNFTSPVYLTGPGGDTGNITTDTRGYVPVSKAFAVSAANRTVTRTLPPNTNIQAITYVVASAVAGIAAGVTVRAGTAASPALYGTVSVSAEGVYTMTLTKQVINDPTTVIIDATAQASAADWTTLKGLARITYGTRA